MRIDIGRLTEDELVDLKHRVVARLRFLQQARAPAEMRATKIGDRVTVPATRGRADHGHPHPL
jgi:hypothetical protein